jgi:hypothetical protein
MYVIKAAGGPDRNFLACFTKGSSSLRKSRKTLALLGYCLFVSGAFRAKRKTDKGLSSSIASFFSNCVTSVFSLMIEFGLNNTTTYYDSEPHLSFIIKMGRVGFEPTTPAMSRRYLNQARPPAHK